MRVSLSTAALVSAAKAVAPAVSGRPTVPLLAGVMVSAHPEGIELSATDLDTSARAVVDALVVDAEQSAPVLVSHRLLTQILAVCTADTVELNRLVPDAPLVVTAGRARWELPTMNLDLYPRLPSPPAVLGRVSAADFRASAKMVALAAATDDSRMLALDAMRLEFTADGLDMVCTDSLVVNTRRMAWEPVIGQDGDVAVLVRAKQLLQFLDQLSGDVEVYADAGTVGFKSAGRSFVTRQTAPSQGRDWINWRGFVSHAVSAEPALSAEMAQADLVTAIKQAQALSPTEENKARLVTLTLEEGTCSIAAGDEDLGSRAGVEFDAEVTGRPACIVASAQLLLAALACIPDDYLRLATDHPARKALALGYVNTLPSAFVMPVRNPVAGWLDGEE